MGALFSYCCPCCCSREPNNRENSNYGVTDSTSRYRGNIQDTEAQYGSSRNTSLEITSSEPPRNQYVSNDYTNPGRTYEHNQQSVNSTVSLYSPYLNLPSGNNYSNQDYHSQQIANRKTQRELDEQRKEFEHQQKLQRMQQESRIKQEEAFRQITQQNQDFELRRQRKQNEQEARLEELRRSAKIENDRKNREDELAIETMKFENSQRNTEVYSPYLDSLKEKSLKQDEQFRNNKIRFKNEEMDRTLKYQQAQEEHTLRRQKIDEEFEEKCQKLNEEAQQRQREMNRQFEEIKKIMQMRVWNDTIERNWTNRLNEARSANKDSQILEHRCLVSSPRPTDIEEWKHVLQILLKNMENESSNMSVMYDNTNKSFLLDIQKAVDEISFSCACLLRELDHGANLTKLTNLTGKLNRACMNIPTLAELKRNYYAEMQNNSQL
ncbi:Protein containing ALS2cr12 (ALS2CR12) signature [Caenorhabditis elegans]|uniref:Protein containing ALS2cr12 (ALS2CR12) signature n=1 Tax=Caenorhabditis elegans TaxID=6239 RepID=O01622_CAEEL|nr:Protein containing ALS2cr12 (ALS2CR12) signature [Caenorhabditis elegans]CCD74296.2 Protein containing ALS2cr12 (ALS2CR12) signature [Caenorhabditis elegans]|eukprot:NP_504026.3 Protein containing ALS2cr12 (ALS2CR12) signature [Caenorhabditis elegans]